MVICLLLKRDHMTSTQLSGMEFWLLLPLNFPLDFGQIVFLICRLPGVMVSNAQLTTKATLHLKFHEENISSRQGKSL